MGMATFTDDEAQLREEFQKLAALKTEFKDHPSIKNTFFDQLSMGMSVVLKKS
jgi:uncharacterized pyridoxal phosphate-containing UPF0001 family protein